MAAGLGDVRRCCNGMECMEVAIMKRTRLLSIEVGTRCNLSARHTLCPSNERRSGGGHKRMTDARVVRVIADAHRAGFRGLVGFHYYCEPMVYWQRIKRLVASARIETPEVKYILWTNGTILPDDFAALRLFDTIVVTDYNGDGHRWDGLAEHVHVMPPSLDRRRSCPVDLQRMGPCELLYREMPIDTWGNVHLCCYDWQGRHIVGNVQDVPFPEIVRAWREVRKTLATEDRNNDPEPCRTCSFRRREPH
jgi:radical SAM protein with 4Fe4S-binding SPASM domain